LAYILERTTWSARERPNLARPGPSWPVLARPGLARLDILERPAWTRPARTSHPGAARLDIQATWSGPQLRGIRTTPGPARDVVVEPGAGHLDMKKPGPCGPGSSNDCERRYAA